MSDSTATGYLDALLAGQAALAGGAGARLASVRARALERANALTVPSLRDEEWRYTDLSPLYKTAYRPAHGAGSFDESFVSSCFVPEATCRLTFVDGHFVERLSTGLASGGVSVQRLSAAAESAVVRDHLANIAPFAQDAFVAVNTAWLNDGVVVHVAAGQRVNAPIHLLFVSSTPEVAVYPRVLCVAERGSHCVLIEDYVASHEAACLVNGVTEIALGEGAQLQHVRLQRESRAAFHIGACAVRMARDSHYAATSVAFGGRISRYDLNVTQSGEGAASIIDGLALIGGRQVADTHSMLDHTVPNGRSRQVHKCIVDGAARAVFNGKIFVRPGAQRTDSGQQTRSLLLSPRAQVDAKPQLEIFADDVKCAHGAAIGQLDAEQVFYLKSRGLDETAARNLLVFAFAAEIVRRIPVPSLVGRLERSVLQQTQNQDRIHS